MNSLPDEWCSWPLSGAQTLHARSFGTESGDLDVDFRRHTRPEVVTRLVAACVRPEGGDEWTEDDVWYWPLTRRTQALLALAAATRGTDLRVLSRCSNAACAELMEVHLDLMSLRRSCDETAFEFQPAPGVRLRLRVPCGDDQRKAGAVAEQDPLALMRLLVVEGDANAFQRAWLAQAEASLEEHDELTAMSLRSACPWCGLENEFSFDLEGHLLRDLQRRQESLLDGVHRLARAYHWSESEIIRLPPHRLEYYLRRIQEEAG